MKNLNEATAEELERAAQIDGTRARYIVEHRQQRGAFESWEDVMEVPSFEHAMVERLQQAGFGIGGGTGEQRASKRSRKGLRTSKETSAEQAEIAKAQGDALKRAIDAMREETGNLQLQRAGDYLVGCCVEEAEGLYTWRNGKLEWSEPSRENAHVEILVCDPQDGRFVPGLEVTAAVYDPDGKELGRHAQPMLWHPWLPHYGRSWTLPGDGEYTIAVHVEPLQMSRHDKVNGGRFTRPLDVEFSGVSIETGQKKG